MLNINYLKYVKNINIASVYIYMTKLHLGCGNLKLEHYINIDISSKVADIKANITNLQYYNNNTISEIYCCHVFEHIKRCQLVNTLLEWNRILDINGKLRLSVPDFEKAIKIYQKNHDMSEIIGFLNGGQTDEYDIHFVNFDLAILTELLETCGFTNICKYNQDEFLGEKDDYSKCYLPHMDKTGELMSLNIICEKNKNMTLNNIVLSSRLKKYLKL